MSYDYPLNMMYTFEHFFSLFGFFNTMYLCEYFDNCICIKIKGMCSNHRTCLLLSEG
jgi:hypothetical protein